MTTDQTIEGADPFLQRAIEYWLDSSNELGYQPLFCGWLSNAGYAVKHSSKHGPFEQGKDIIATDDSGLVHAFQLKGGDINLKRWRDEVKPEIDELIDIPVKHPGVDKSKPHVSYLVTNGTLDDTVRVQIVDLNESKWKATPLQVWTRGDLLNNFLTMANGIFPADAETYKQLTDLMFADSTSLPDIEQINSFFQKILNPNEKSPKEQRRRDIAAVMLYANLIVGPYRMKGNHVSVIRVATLLVSQIMLIVDRYNLEDQYWLESYEIIQRDILTTAEALELEIENDEFTKAFTSPLDRDTMPLRKHMALLYVFALKLAELITNDDSWKTIERPEMAARYKDCMSVWGEASFIPLIFLAFIAKKFSNDGKEQSYKVLASIVTYILALNGRKSKNPPGLLPPYYDADFAVKVAFGLLDEEMEEDYKYNSYYLKPIIETLARGGAKDVLVQNWQEISFMRFEQFVLPEDWRYYLWRSEDGDNETMLPKNQQSWKELVEMGQKIKGDKLPKTLKRFPIFVPFFLALFAHRLDSETLGFLDKITT
jgi:hypothetical protein